jgi:hypothetical protein
MNKKANYGEIMRYIPDYRGFFMQKVRKPERLKITNPERFVSGRVFT